jgi:hypothetical protein
MDQEYKVVSEDGALVPSMSEYLYEPPVDSDVAALLDLIAYSSDAATLLPQALRLLDLEEDYLGFRQDMFPDEE